MSPKFKAKITSRGKGKILYLRRNYNLGQLRISWYLKRYHGISISSDGVWNVLKRNGMSRLPRNTRKRAMTTHRYEKQAPGHHSLSTAVSD